MQLKRTQNPVHLPCFTSVLCFLWRESASVDTSELGGSFRQGPGGAALGFPVHSIHLAGPEQQRLEAVSRWQLATRDGWWPAALGGGWMVPCREAEGLHVGLMCAMTAQGPTSFLSHRTHRSQTGARPVWNRAWKDKEAREQMEI